jgi:oxygen-independent coproporphyrinogen-3 oxidase
VSLDKARLLLAHGVNRISMGVQSLNEALLERLGRVHTRSMAFKSYDILRQAGFKNVNLDLMFAIPGQTLSVWRETLAEVASMGSEHLSSYEVIYEEDTALYAQLQAGEFDVDEDLACAMYEELVAHAGEAGFEQYEIANFARHCSAGSTAVEEMPAGDAQVPRLACRHNVNYWRGGSFYGLGPSATSYVRGVRTKNVANTSLYCARLERGESAAESREELSPLARAGETAAFGLRMVAGWPFDQFQTVTGQDLRKAWPGEMAELAGRGWGCVKSDRFQLTPQGLRFADAAAQLFLK